jgi:hypothetical protein
VAGRCVFCGHGPLTREHVIARWLTEVLHERERFRGHDQQVILPRPRAARSRLLWPHHEMREPFNAMTVKAVLHPTPAPARPIPPTRDRALPHRRDRARRSNRVRGPGGADLHLLRAACMLMAATPAGTSGTSTPRSGPMPRGPGCCKPPGTRPARSSWRTTPTPTRPRPTRTRIQAMDLTVRSRPRWRLPRQEGEPACRQVEPFTE